jgi:RimJ/RimL family protein N-acetyltransferase
MVGLEPMDERHFDRTFKWLSGSAELRWQVDSIDVPTLEGNRCYWRRNLQVESREDYAIVAEGGKHVGNCGLVQIDRQRGKAEMWIYLGGDHGTGLGSAALEELLKRAFDGLGLNRVSLRVVDGNGRAIAFYQRAGFKIEGRARSDTIRDGKRIDSTLMSLLRDEHRAQRTETA